MYLFQIINVVGAHKMIPKCFEERLEELEFRERIETI